MNALALNSPAQRIGIPEVASRLPSSRVSKKWLLIAAALSSLIVKLSLAWSTIGTNDSLTFLLFARDLQTHSLSHLYNSSILFNHPPLTGYFIRAVYYLVKQSWLQEQGVTFFFLLRLPGIIADFITVLAIAGLAENRLRDEIRPTLLYLFALSPISIMVTGFHGNTDPILAMFMVLAAIACLNDRPILAGVYFALSLQVKVAPFIVAPVFFFYWLARGKGLRFLAPVCVITVLGWAEPLSTCPQAFARNVLSYGGYWGCWGIPYLLNRTGLPEFSGFNLIRLTQTEHAISLALKLSVMIAIIILSWRRRSLGGTGFLRSLGYSWIIFFSFSPGVAPQYFVWIGPFLLFLDGALFIVLTAGSSVFLFLFYNTIAHGLPWYLAVSRNKMTPVWAPWTLVPWILFLVVIAVSWWKAARRNTDLRFWSLTAVPPRFEA